LRSDFPVPPSGIRTTGWRSEKDPSKQDPEKEVKVEAPPAPGAVAETENEKGTEPPPLTDEEEERRKAAKMGEDAFREREAARLAKELAEKEKVDARVQEEMAALSLGANVSQSPQAAALTVMPQ
jgi:hypothetical protein